VHRPLTRPGASRRGNSCCLSPYAELEGVTERCGHRINDQWRTEGSPSTVVAMRPTDAITHMQAADLLGVRPSTVAHMVQRGELRSHRTKPCLSRRQVEAVADLRKRFRMKASVSVPANGPNGAQLPSSRACLWRRR
jgi:excisionase family DNA binding protein